VQKRKVGREKKGELTSMKMKSNNKCEDGRSSDAPLNSLMDSTKSPKVMTMEGEGVGARSLSQP
jgi:hypothetical protein